MAEPIKKELFEILACPVCKGDLSYTSDKKGLSCASCNKEYEIKEGIPVLLPPKEKKVPVEKPAPEEAQPEE